MVDWAMPSQENFSQTSFFARSTIPPTSLYEGLERIPQSDSASSCGFSFSTSQPFLPCSIMSSGPQHFVASAGVQAAIASIIVIQKPSVLLGNTNSRDFLYSATRLSPSIRPKNFTNSPNPYESTKARYSDSEYPYPTNRISNPLSFKNSASASLSIRTDSISTSIHFVHSRRPTKRTGNPGSLGTSTPSNIETSTPLGMTTGRFTLG